MKDDFTSLSTSAEKGDVKAQYKLGMHYFDDGVSEHKKLAVEWWSKAADQGYAEAQSNLGYMYDHGVGVEKDKKDAMKWFRKAAKLRT